MNLIQGTVLTDQGKPIAGASVFISRSPVSVPDIAQLSNAQGKFSLTVPAIGDYTIQIAAAGFQITEMNVHVAKQKATVNVRLSRER
jgi:hypothetical protein